MNFIRTSRRWHRWISILVTPAFAVTLITGILLSTRGFNPWLQPNYGPQSLELRATFDQILETARAVPEAKIQKWADVSLIDVRPATGLIRVRSKHTMVELQIDATSGKLSGTGIRRVSWITSLHEGANFGPWVRYGIFLTSSVGVLFVMITGIIIYTIHYRHLRSE